MLPRTDGNQTTTITSTELLDDLCRGDGAAWDHFCQRYQPMLLAFARRFGRQEEDARDVVQNALLAFLEGFRAGKYERGRGRLRSWLRGIMFNKIRETRRALDRPEGQAPGSDGSTEFMARVPDDHSMGDVFEQEWNRWAVGECLRLLRQEVSPQTFELFELHVKQDWPPDKLAQHFGISRGGVYSAIFRVRARLRALGEDLEGVP